MKIKSKIFFLFFISLLSSQIFSAPFSLLSSSTQVLASVTVGSKTEIITKADLDNKIQEYKAVGANNTDEEVLEILVNDKVFLMSADRDKVSVSDAEVDERLKQIRSQIDVQLGRQVSDEEFNEYILASSQTFTSMDEYKEELKKVLLVDKYVRSIKGDEMDKPVVVADSEINAFYRKNKTQFVNPEFIRVSHIFALKTDDVAQNSKSREKLNSVLSDIKSGNLTFEKAVQQYSEDNESKTRGGDIGSVTSNATNVLGENFVDIVFTLEPGDIAPDVVESTQGYHIIKATAHSDAKFLGINDYVTPDTNITVKEYIRNYLQQQKVQENYTMVVNAFVEELKKSARITYTNS